MLGRYFQLRGELTKKEVLFFNVIGVFLFLCVWEALPRFGFVSPHILPGPLKTLGAARELWHEDALGRNLVYSVILTTSGNAIAIVVALVLGYLMGLFTPIKALLSQIVNALRYLPITALIGPFIIWFGISAMMKISFLAFGTVVFLLAAAVQRVEDVDQVYVDTVKTLGASRWQRVTKVFWPGALAQIAKDIRVLFAVSWTYIIAAEIVNKSDGGIGALIETSKRQSRIDKTFFVLGVVILTGFITDRILLGIDRLFFPHKYVGGAK